MLPTQLQVLPTRAKKAELQVTQRTGWICPRCQSALSPDVARCACVAQAPIEHGPGFGNAPHFTPPYVTNPQWPEWAPPLRWEITCDASNVGDGLRIRQDIAAASKIYGAST